MTKTPMGRGVGQSAKGGKHATGKGGDGRHAYREALPSVQMEERKHRVDGHTGVAIFKISKVDLASRREVSVTYTVEFDGHSPIPFERLILARDRAKLPAPERQEENHEEVLAPTAQEVVA